MNWSDWRWVQRTARPLRNDTHVYDAGDTHWRGAQLREVNIGAQTATVRIVLEPHIIGDRTIALLLLPADARAIGDPLVVRLTGNNPADFAVAEVRGSRFAGVTGPGTDQAGSVARELFFPGVITKREDPSRTRYLDGD
jgi:hypothetical protein